MPKSYQLRLVPLDGSMVLHVSGEIDLTAHDEVLDVAMPVIVDGSAKALLVDMANVTFLDSSGILAIVTLTKAGHANGVKVRVMNPSEVVRRTLEVAACTALIDEQAASALKG